MLAQPTFYFGRTWHVPIYSAWKTLALIGKKILFTDIDRKKWPSTSARKDDRSRSKKEVSPDDADRTFPNRHHANFIQRLNRKNNSRHRSWNSPDWYFSADISQFFLKRSPADNVFFLRQRKFSCFCVALKICNVGRQGFFVRARPTFCFGRNWHVPIYSEWKTLAHLGKKNIIHQYWSEKMTVDVGQERQGIEV